MKTDKIMIGVVVLMLVSLILTILYIKKKRGDAFLSGLSKNRNQCFIIWDSTKLWISKINNHTINIYDEKQTMKQINSVVYTKGWNYLISEFNNDFAKDIKGWMKGKIDISGNVYNHHGDRLN